MPILTIQAAAPENPTAIPEMIAEIRSEGARAIDTTPDNLWVIFEPLSRPLHPPIVSIRANRGRTRETKDALARAVSKAVSRGLGMEPSQVWIHYQEMNPDDIWFGSPGINLATSSLESENKNG